MKSDEPRERDANHPLVPTNDPAATEAEYVAQGFVVSNLYSRQAYPSLCAGCVWAIDFWRPEQPDLL